MKKMFLLLLLVQGIIAAGFSQEETEEFKPKGNPLALIFADFNTTFSDGKTSKSFNITRTYLGYEYDFSKEIYAKVVLDVGDPKVGALERVAYLKNAYIQYSTGNLTAYFGLISTTQFKTSEKIWGYRYVEKSFQDAYKFNSSADYGVNLVYEFSDFISADFSIINGEGYKVLQKDDYLRTGLGITINPINDITARVFADNMGDDVKQKSLATFLAYTGEQLTVGAEYNYQNNMGMEDGHDIFGTSFYATFKPSDKVKIFGRFDDLGSETLDGENDPWQLSKDGQLIMAGVEYNPLKGIKVAPNFRLWNAADDAVENTSYLYLNVEIKF